MNSPSPLVTFGIGSLLVGGGAMLYSAAVDADPRSGRPALPWTKSAFVSQMQDAVNQSGIDVPASAVPLIIAQAAYESSWGRGTAYRQGNNAFNITAGSSWSGPTVPGGDTQCDAGSNCTPITQQWRVYDSLAQGVADWWNFIGRTAPGAQADIMAGNSNWVTRLGPKWSGGSGYYTLNPGEYLARYQSTLASVNGV